MAEHLISRHDKWRLFFISFFITFFIIGSMALATLYWFSPPSPHTSSAPLGGGAYLPTSLDDFTFLTVIQDPDSGLMTFILTGFFPTRGNMPVAVFPQDTLLVGQHKTDTLLGVYRTGGTAYVKSALESCFELSIDRCASIDSAGFIAVADRMGITDFRLPITLTASDGTTKISSGMQQLDGSRMIQIINHSNFPEGELQRCQITSHVISAMLNTHLPLADSPNADAVFKTAVSVADTDLSQADYQQRKPAASFMARLEIKPAQPLTLDGSYNTARNTFTLDDASVKALKLTFGPSQSG